MELTFKHGEEWCMNTKCALGLNAKGQPVHQRMYLGNAQEEVKAIVELHNCYGAFEHKIDGSGMIKLLQQDGQDALFVIGYDSKGPVALLEGMHLMLSPEFHETDIRFPGDTHFREITGNGTHDKTNEEFNSIRYDETTGIPLLALTGWAVKQTEEKTIEDRTGEKMFEDSVKRATKSKKDIPKSEQSYGKQIVNYTLEQVAIGEITSPIGTPYIHVQSFAPDIPIVKQMLENLDAVGVGPLIMCGWAGFVPKKDYLGSGRNPEDVFPYSWNDVIKEIRDLKKIKVEEVAPKRDWDNVEKVLFTQDEYYALWYVDYHETPLDAAADLMSSKRGKTISRSRLEMLLDKARKKAAKIVVDNKVKKVQG